MGRIKKVIGDFVINRLAGENNSYDIKISLEKPPASTKRIIPLFKLSNKIRKGFLSEIELREGLKIIINDYNLKKPITVNFQIEEAPLEFAFCLSGNIRAIIENENIPMSDFSIRQGSNSIFFLPNSMGRLELYGGEPIKIISIHVDPGILNNFIANDIKNLPDSLINLIKNKRNHPFISISSMNSQMFSIANQILDCMLKGISRRMFLESKALELMSLKINQLQEIYSDKPVKVRITDKDIGMVEELVEILKTDLRNPHSLDKLSRIAGVNHTKLNFIFRSVKGQTIFSFLRNIRLEKSKELIETSHLNITEISFITGFSNPSHFTREFIKKYKISPKSYQKAINNLL
ncbi:MAG: AraC family transcriptional regulator [Bacteroidetes bacterium]|nr:AraC family transcriptional regulator [Bacteroidota bacterium]